MMKVLGGAREWDLADELGDGPAPDALVDHELIEAVASRFSILLSCGDDTLGVLGAKRGRHDIVPSERCARRTNGHHQIERFASVVVERKTFAGGDVDSIVGRDREAALADTDGALAR
jgi:hypothetical protein